LLNSVTSSESSPLQVLLVEDDEQLAISTRAVLEREKFRVAVFDNAESALEQARALPPDLVVMDLTLPGIDGIEACRQLRTFSDAYVIMLTGLDNEADRLAGLAVGADDYMTKPYSPRELVARIKAMQRRPRGVASGGPVRQFGELQIDPGTREVTVSGAAIALTRTEYDLLDTLASQPRTALSRRQLLEAVWGDSWFGDDHMIDVHLSNLRRKLGDPAYIKTVRGYGYRMGSG
jgi:DNA-binding response OmpR family regulator